MRRLLSPTALAVAGAVAIVLTLGVTGYFVVFHKPARSVSSPAAARTAAPSASEPAAEAPAPSAPPPPPSALPSASAAPVSRILDATGRPLPTTHPLHGELSTYADTVTGEVSTTIDPRVQAAADTAVVNLRGGGAATIIAIDRGGAIRAVGRNAPGGTGLGGTKPLAGLFPPGSTFKIVTAAAALDAGLATADTALPCPASTTATGRPISNDPGVGDRGTPTLRNAFAFSCNSTMINLAVKLPDGALERTALQYGIGVDWTIPGATSHSGRVPRAASAAIKGEDSIGQGHVEASPFAMAMVAATLRAGALPRPTLVTGRPATAGSAPPRLNAGTASTVRTFARAAVTSGTASPLRGVSGEVAGKTGTAQRQGQTDHSWFVGYRGDLAFAVFIENGGSSHSGAVPMTRDFLTSLR